MKLLYCRRCTDIIRLTEEERSCGCGACAGRYVRGARATYSGPAVPLGIPSLRFRLAVDAWTKATDREVPFEAHIASRESETFLKQSPLR